MSAARSVLVLTHRFDPTADKVVEELNNRDVPLFRCDASDFPEQLSVGAELTDGRWTGQLRTALRSLDLSAVSGIYYRRPTNFEFHPGMSENERRWAAIQAQMGFGGLLASLEPWLNHPHQIGYVEYKPVQLRAAVACGLPVPGTLVTNNPGMAHEFVSRVGRAVCKPFGGTGVNDDDGYRQLFSTVVEPQQCDDLNIARTMHLFQEWVPKEYEVRLTVVDGHFFAARIDGESEAARVDWRSDYNALSYQVIKTPNLVRSQVSNLLNGLGLRFAALDFVVTPEGEWWFLECNSNGQWAWIEEETGMPITRALADALDGSQKRDGH
ncbi:MAG: ATP-grasp ribosomal peptide maturase [Pseudonocardia sp.]|nr:ATP-grasp ribosomal peptide maturase [Pseudonocardia sp.]